MERYIEDKKTLYTKIIEFLENPIENFDELNKIYMQQLSDILKNQQIECDREELKQFLLTIKSVSDDHHRDKHFNEKINQILQNYKELIKQTYSNDEIYQIFENNKMILLYLLKNNILTITESIYKDLISKIEPNGNRYCYFFYPELENFIGIEKMKDIRNEIMTKCPTFFEKIEEKRQEGQNESHICSLIRQDSIKEFIVFLNRNNYSVLSQINPSIFETNSFLIANENTSLIEYSAFFGSIQIFQYLVMNKAELKSSLWLYAIHSKNAELIHILESYLISPPNNNYIHCLTESIKCHHNDIADYIENNLLNQNEDDSEQKENILSNIMNYHNYDHFQTEEILGHGFFYLNFYNYKKLFEFILEKKEKEMQKKIIQ